MWNEKDFPDISRQRNDNKSEKDNGDNREQTREGNNTEGQEVSDSQRGIDISEDEKMMYTQIVKLTTVREELLRETKKDGRGMKRKFQETEAKDPDTKRARTKEDGWLVAGNTPCYTQLLARSSFPRPEPMDLEEELATFCALRPTQCPANERKRTDISPNEPQQKKLGKRKGKEEPQKKQAEKKQKKQKKMEAPKNQAEKNKKKEDPQKKQSEKRTKKGAKGPQNQEKDTRKTEAITMSEAEVAELLKEGKELGAGTYGTAYKVVHKGEVTVLKVANSRLWSVKAAFRKEAKVLQALNGKGGAPLLFGTCSKPAAILMEYCPGEEFLSFINDSKNSPSLALGILPDIARELHKIHLAGYVHVDLKTDNVMVHVTEGKGKKQVKPRIIDFGIAVERRKVIELYPNFSDSIYPHEYTEGCGRRSPSGGRGVIPSGYVLLRIRSYAFNDHIPQHYEEIINMAKNENPKLRPTVPKLVKLLEAARKMPDLQ
ncbi:PC4 and SFRS1-interacting protein-like [Macrobrachium nipponense]|uniref:PC4 and SFRS1-interacting protein-like n=1 Tax=Macrobrachium nipponense TaxID=159736 RepID=UPI0030C7A945